MEKVTGGGRDQDQNCGVGEWVVAVFCHPTRQDTPSRPGAGRGRGCSLNTACCQPRQSILASHYTVALSAATRSALISWVTKPNRGNRTEVARQANRIIALIVFLILELVEKSILKWF